MSRPKHDKPPQRVYLQFLPESDISDEEGREIELSEHEHTFCFDRIWDSDLEYVRADLFRSLEEENHRLQAHNEYQETLLEERK